MIRDERKAGQTAYALLAELFPICRSLTGDGVRKTLQIIKQRVPLTVHEVPSGAEAFDWTVPKEWNIADGFISDESGQKIVDFQQNNLHVMGYSVPVDQTLSLVELSEHLYSEPDQPDAIPYVTSYYKPRWGFCLSENQRRSLTDQQYRVKIDSRLEDGHLTYGEMIIPGRSKQEIFFSSYICHPSMANDEASGPAVITELGRWLQASPRKYSYRIVWIPETIGSLVYLSRNLEVMQKNIIAGFNVSCVGDNRTYSHVASRYGNTLADRVLSHVLEHRDPGHKKYSFLERGSDERQYCSPGVDLPVATFCRSKYREYPEYHTSLDDLDMVSAEGLGGAFGALTECVTLLENNVRYRVTCKGEPQLGERGLYPDTSRKNNYASVQKMMDFLAYADGENDLVEIGRIIGVSALSLLATIEVMKRKGLITAAEESTAE